MKRRYFRGDAAFANPEIYEFLEAEGMGYAIRLPANRVVQDKIGHLHQVDAAVMPFLRRQRRPPSAPCAGLQPRQFHVDAGDAEGGEPWSLTSLREKLVKIGAKVLCHGRYVTFQMAEVAVPRQMFAEILMLIARLRAPPAPA